MVPPSPHAACASSDAHRRGDHVAPPPVLGIGCRFEFDADTPTHAVVIVEPHESERGRVLDERFAASGVAISTTYSDGFGNRCRRMTLPAGRSAFTYRATVRNDAGFDHDDVDAHEVPVGDLPDHTLAFLLPSRYCPSDELASVALDQFGTMAPGWRRVDAIAGWVHAHLDFAYGSSSPTKTAADALRDRAGTSPT
jgi:transglutaminase-like putative cysteine protease